MKWPLAVLLLLAGPVLCAQPSDTEVGGYVKYLFSLTDVPGEDAFSDHLLHARLNTKWFPAENLSGILEFRARAFYGGTVERTPDFAGQLGHDAGFGRLGAVLWDGQTSVGYAEIDRCYLNWAPGRWQISVGRQRVAWGTNLVWNPIDLFNPLSVLDFDYEERPAVDAVRMQYYTGEVSKVEVVVKPGTAASKAISAFQWTTNAHNYDFHFLGGRRGHEWFAGTGWAGDISGGGFRGEVLAAQIPDELKQQSSRGILVSTALSGDYTLPNSFYIHTEVLYNSEGVVAEASLARLRSVMLGLLSPARWSLYQEFGYDVSPLVRAGAFGIYNPSDHSWVLVPSVTWSVVTNLDLTFLVLTFHGSSLTEYGDLGTVGYVRAKWSF